MSATTLPRLTARGHKMDLSEECFGEMQNSADIADDMEALRERMREEGYFYLPGYLDREGVLEARRVVTSRLAEQGFLDPDSLPMEAVANPEHSISFKADLAVDNPALDNVLYAGRMMEFYRRFLGGKVRHFDYTWFRSVGPGHGTSPHCDIVYMGRGTKQLYTAWTPIGDISYELGGLMILEKSHLHEKINKGYGQRDVDAYCTNRADAPLIVSGKKSWQWNGSLTDNPVSLREKLGGRWLTTEFRAGDLVIFGMFTIHASTDNHSKCYRLSSDSRYQLASEPVDERWIGEKPIAHGIAGKRGRIC